MNTIALRRLTKRPFIRNVAILTSGNSIAQVLTIAASPILTRLYGPDAFGSFGLLIALSAMLVVVSGLRYELAVVPAKDDSIAANLLILSLGIILLVSGFSALIVAVAADWIAALVERPEFAPLLWWLPILVLGGGLHQAVNYWTIRRKLYKRIAVSRVVQAVASLSLQAAAGVAGLGSTGLISGRMLGSVVGTSILTTQLWRADRALLFSAMKLKDIWAAAKDYSHFPKYNAPHNLISSLSRTSIPYALAPLFGVEVVGLYYLAERVMRTPSSFVINSVRRVFYQRSSELYNNGKSFYRLLVKTLAGLFSIAVVPYILFIFFGPELFAFVFGAEWERAGTLVQWLVNWWFLAFLAGPAIESLTVLALQKYLLYFQIALSIARVLAIIFGAMVGDEITAIAACSIVSAAFNLCLILSVLIVVRARISPHARTQTNG